MGKVGRATCIVCGEEFDKNEMEEIFVGRVRYRCMKCVAQGDKQARARITESFRHGALKKIQEQRWK